MSALALREEALHFKIKYPLFQSGSGLIFVRDPRNPLMELQHLAFTFIISGLKGEYWPAAHSGLTVNVCSQTSKRREWRSASPLIKPRLVSSLKVQKKHNNLSLMHTSSFSRTKETGPGRFPPRIKRTMNITCRLLYHPTPLLWGPKLLRFHVLTPSAFSLHIKAKPEMTIE